MSRNWERRVLMVKGFSIFWGGAKGHGPSDEALPADSGKTTPKLPWSGLRPSLAMPYRGVEEFGKLFLERDTRCKSANYRLRSRVRQIKGFEPIFQ